MSADSPRKMQSSLFGVAIGAGVGAGLGIAFGFMVIGIAVGVGVGFALEARPKSQRHEEWRSSTASPASESSTNPPIRL